MSSGLLETVRRNVGLRLSLLYALIFSVSSVALLAVAYYLLVAAVGNKDREVLEARLKEAAVVYETGGIIGLRSWVANQPAEVQQFGLTTASFLSRAMRQIGLEPLRVT